MCKIDPLYRMYVLAKNANIIRFNGFFVTEMPYWILWLLLLFHLLTNVSKSVANQLRMALNAVVTPPRQQFIYKYPDSNLFTLDAEIKFNQIKNINIFQSSLFYYCFVLLLSFFIIILLLKYTYWIKTWIHISKIHDLNVRYYALKNKWLK